MAESNASMHVVHSSWRLVAIASNSEPIFEGENQACNVNWQNFEMNQKRTGGIWEEVMQQRFAGMK